jgi:hypothetical protein
MYYICTPPDTQTKRRIEDTLEICMDMVQLLPLPQRVPSLVPSKNTEPIEYPTDGRVIPEVVPYVYTRTHCRTTLSCISLYI